MKKLIILLLVATAVAANAQKTEFSFQLGSGLFSFRGTGAANESFINDSDVVTIPSYTNNPYGKKSGLSYTFAIQTQRVTKGKLIYGGQLGYEALASRIKITGIVGESSTAANGNTTLTTTYVKIYPYLGKRFSVHDVDVDLLVGIDISPIISSKEKGKATGINGNIYETVLRKNHPTTDFGPRIMLNGYYKNVGVSIGYTYGLMNYDSTLGGNSNVHSQLIRIAVIYRKRSKAE